MPSQKDIEKRIKEEFDKLPELTADLPDKVKIVYKAVPTDPAEVIKRSVQLPKGANPDQVAKQYAPMAKPYIEKYLAQCGKLTAQVDFHVKSLKVAPGEYTFGLKMSDLTPVAVLITGKTLRAPITLPLKPGTAPNAFASLNVVLKDGGKDDFTIDVGWAKFLGATEKIKLKK